RQRGVTDASEVAPERLAVEQLHRHPGQAVVAAALEDARDVGAVERGTLELARGIAGAEALDRDLAVLRMVGEPHRTGGPGADLPYELEHTAHASIPLMRMSSKVIEAPGARPQAFAFATKAVVLGECGSLLDCRSCWRRRRATCSPASIATWTA